MRLLITGGTGTFGRACIRRALMDTSWTAIVSYSRDEQKAAALAEEFGSAQPFKAFLGDVRDTVRLGLAMRGVDVVVHAAALKRIDVGAYSPSELIATNIGGTMNVVNAAIHAGVKRVVVLSSDKAVHPSNLYGSTKHCSETYAVQANSYGYPSGTRIAAVRYGNILGSRGSVAHIWSRQIAKGQSLTITDQRMSRFVMTIEQAVDLVLFAIAETQGGEVFVPRLPSARMTDLAWAVWRWRKAGDGPPQIVETGLRPGGEKLAERLLSDEEGARTRERTDRRGGFYAVAPSHHDWTPREHAWYGSSQTLSGWQYASDGADQEWLGVPELCDFLSSTEAMRCP